MQDAVCTHAHKTDCAGVDVEFSSDNRVDMYYSKNISGVSVSAEQANCQQVCWNFAHGIYFDKIAYVNFVVEF